MSETSGDASDALLTDEFTTEIFEIERTGPGLFARMGAELVGTFILVFMGVGTALFISAGNNGSLTAAFGFAAGVIIAIVIVGGISGAHLNPAVTLGLWIAGRFPGRDFAPYVLAQVVGASIAGAVLWGLVQTHPQVANAREFLSGGANGYGDHSPIGFTVFPALIVEAIITALLVAVVLSVTSRRAANVNIPFTVGFTVGFLVLVAVPFTNGALNPARATGIALFAEPWALTQLWAWWLAPLLGAAVAGLLFRAFGPEEDILGSAADVEYIEEIDIIAVDGRD